MTYSHKIIRTERGETKNSRSPMWRCQTDDGQRVNVFQHSDPAKDTSLLFDRAGYLGDMLALKMGEALEWSGFPIQVQMQPDGDWWKVTAVEPRPEGAQPDSMWKPDLEAYRWRAFQQANWLTHLVAGFNVIDIESTGLRADDEMISVAIIHSDDGIMIDSLVKPNQPSKMERIGKNGTKASEVHGITSEMLHDAPILSDLYAPLSRALNGANVVGYNVKFDLQMLERNFADTHLPLPIYDSVWDVAQLVAEFVGNWNPKRGWFEMLKLEEACAYFGISLDDAHDARADANATLKLLKAMAAADPETWRQPF